MPRDYSQWSRRCPPDEHSPSSKSEGTSGRLEFDRFVNEVGFRLLPPSFYIIGINKFIRLSECAGFSLEVLNTCLPEDSRLLRHRVEPLLRIPRMSTFAIGAMINRAVQEMEDGCCFLNVGVWNGFTLLAGMAGNANHVCIGIDNFSQFGGPRDAFLTRFNELRSLKHHFHDQDYREYFKYSHEGQIGLYIYDGDHSYENQLEGLRVAEPFFSRHCLILVDDTNMESARRGTLDFVERSENEYEIIFDRTTCRNRHPTLWNGIMILRRMR